MKKLLFFLFVSTFYFCCHAQSKDEVSITNAMVEQQKAWNSGDLDHFMQTYWRSDSLMFIGKNGPTYGWQNTLNNYKKGYPDTAAMGKLNFDIISIKRLSGLYYSVVGKWYLKRSIGNIGGAFTLLFKKINMRWVIIQDHSS